jgi:hypothetical protein
VASTATANRPVPAEADSRREDYAILRSTGLSVMKTARRMGISDSTAWRYERARKAARPARPRLSSGAYGYSPGRGVARG